MKDRDIEILARNFEARTGVDLRDYRRSEIAEVVADLIRFPLYAAKSILMPMLAYLGIGIVLAMLSSGFIPSLAALLAVPILAPLNALTTAALLFIFRLRNDITEAVHAGLGLVGEVSRDVRTVQLKRRNSTFSFPSFVDTFNGVMHVVVVPVTDKVLRRKIPILGRLFSGLVRQLANLTTRRTIDQLVLEHPEALDQVPDDSEDESSLVEGMERMTRIAEEGRGLVSKAIRWASWILLLPALIVFAAVMSLSIGYYWIIL